MHGINEGTVPDKVYIIAEAGSNHNGELSVAYELVDMAAEAGADAIKFQFFKAASLYPRNVGTVSLPGGSVDLFDLFVQLEMDSEWLQLLLSRARTRHIDMLCSVFDESGAEFVNTVGVTAHKIASPELAHLPLIRAVAQFGKPAFASTGLATLGDVDEAVRTWYSHTTQPLTLMHCVTAYPTPEGDANLAVIQTMHACFGVEVGLSDHTTDSEAAPVLATALGASAIEKHVTLSRSAPGPDHFFAQEPEDLRRMVLSVRAVAALPKEERYAVALSLLGKERSSVLLGSPVKRITPSEAPLYPGDRRSIHALRDLKEGDVLSCDNMAVLRSERNLSPGLHPRYWDLLQKRTLTRPISAGVGITWEVLLS